MESRRAQNCNLKPSWTQQVHRDRVCKAHAAKKSRRSRTRRRQDDQKHQVGQGVGQSRGDPGAVHGAGRWNDGGWRRRGEEVNLWSSCGRLSAVSHASRCGAFRGYAIIPPTPLRVPYVTLGDPLGIFWGLLWDPLGTPWGPLGDPLGTTWGPLGNSLGPPGTPWESFGDLWESLGYPLGIFVDVLGFVGEPSATFWGSLWSSFGHFRYLFETFWGQLGAPEASHRPPKEPWESIWGHLGSILEASKAFTKRFAAICKNLQIYCKVLQKSRSGKTETFENQSRIS